MKFLIWLRASNNTIHIISITQKYNENGKPKARKYDIHWTNHNKQWQMILKIIQANFLGSWAILRIPEKLWNFAIFSLGNFPYKILGASSKAKTTLRVFDYNLWNVNIDTKYDNLLEGRKYALKHTIKNKSE